MLKTLKFEVEFKQTGRKITGDHKFEEGLTAITGANEQGKSLRIEMVRFALFGTKALRSAMSTYKKIVVECNLEINNKSYYIKRTTSTVVLKEGKTQLASGTTAVNAAIQKLLGYNLDVFDTANACLQDELSELTKKTPAERKRMVDKTIGLDSIDELIKEITTDLSVNRKSIEELETTVGMEPTEPIQPEDYEPSNDLNTKLNEIRKKQDRKTAIVSELKTLECLEPVEPKQTIAEDIDTLHKKKTEIEYANHQLGVVNSRLKELEDITRPTDEHMKEHEIYIAQNGYEEWEEYRAYEEAANRFVSQGKPEYTDEDLINMGKALNFKVIHEKVDELENNSMVTCPECSANFSLNNDKIKELQSEIPEDFDIEKYIKMMEQYAITDHQEIIIKRGYLQDYEAWESREPPEKPIFPELGTIDEAKARLELMRRQAKDFDRIDGIKNEKLELEKVLEDKRDYNSLILQKKKEEADLSAYQNAKQRWVDYQNKRSEYTEELGTLLEVDKEYELVNTKIEASRLYETKLETYNVELEKYKKVKQRIGDLEEEISVLTNVRSALNDLKPKVKSYLIPSLSRVASNLISQMTNGQRSLIEITEGFDIIVDGQDVNTLSGSGKSVANLAVRIGLGTVLTNKVFSTFFADEIDAYMDEDRGEFTAACLRNLTKVFKQIILVSHKKPDADHYIQL